MDFKIDYGNAIQPQYAAVPGTAVTLGNGEVAYHMVADGAAHVMTAEVYRAFALCRGFRLLDEHVQTIVQRFTALAEKRAAVRGVLESLVTRGLLRTDSDFMRRLARAVPLALAPFRALYIRACDRPAQLAELLRTLIAYERRFQPRRHYVVLDDSRDPDHQARHRELVDAFRAASGARATLVDAALWDRIVARMSAALPDCAEAIAFALARTNADGPRPGPGKGFNLATLLGAGSRYTMLDDDFQFEFRRAADAREGLALEREGGFPIWLFGSRDTALARGEAFGPDPIAAHLEWCGHSLGSLLESGKALALASDGLTGYELGRLPLEPGTRVLATDNGHRGSSRHGGCLFLFRLSGGARDEMWRDRDAFERNLDAPNLWHGPQQAELVSHVNLTPFMLDGSALLPPTLPAGIGEDLLFGELARFLHPDTVVFQSNLTIAHVQEETRSRRAMLNAVYTPAFRELVGDLARGAHDFIKARDPATRMARFASILRDLAEAPAPRRLEVLTGFIANLRSGHIQTLQDALAASSGAGAPDYWQAALSDAIVTTGRLLTTYTTPRLADWRETLDEGVAAERLAHGTHTVPHRDYGRATLDEAACAERLAHALSTFATLLEQWPRIWQYAAEQGERLLDA